MNPISLCYGLNCVLTPQRHVEVLSPSTSERDPFGNRVFVHVISKETVLFSKSLYGEKSHRNTQGGDGQVITEAETGVRHL